MNSQTAGNIGAISTAAVAIIHALASATVQIIRAWKQPVTVQKPPTPPQLKP